ncbi:hypothetical protein [Brevibacillus sp. H7]|jgi:hypothetical protein|uniref:hypothetical protein n=1 Tax=Brevibacillus sp. H7 TaxID=3349138 RepID=UPI0037F1E479
MEKQSDDKKAKHEPTIAPGMEMDALDEEATPEEIENNDYTPVTILYRDWI